VAKSVDKTDIDLYNRNDKTDKGSFNKMVEYGKIETLYERDEASKKLIIGKFRNAYVEFLQNVEWEFTEKVDGTNIRVHWDGHKVEFGGRTDKAQIPAHLLNKLNDLFGGEVNEEIFEQRFGDKDVILFGEGYGDKIQTNGYTNKDEVNFILFDVMIGGNYQPRIAVEEISKYFNVGCVPILLKGTINDGVNYVFNNRKSRVSKVDGEIEGLVGRPKFEMRDRCGNRVIVKIKFRDFA